MAKSSFFGGGAAYESIDSIDTAVADAEAAQAAAEAAQAAAEAAQAAAEAAEANAEAAADEFDDLYLGAKSSDPSVDNDGDALQIGALYWNTTDGEMKAWNGSTWSTVYDRTITIGVTIDGGGSTIATGVVGGADLYLPFAGTITAARMLADTSGSIVVDVWKDTYANFAPTDADSITASAPPTISGSTKSQDTTLTGWTTSFSAGDILRFNVDSVTSIKRVTLSLTALKSLT